MADGDATRVSAPTAAAGRSRHDGALSEALERIGAQGSLPAYALPSDSPFRPDTPDLPVTAVRQLPAAAARYAPFLPGLDDRLKNALASRGISQFFTHQAEAVDHALAGRHVVVVTPTASGKTLCYNAPVLHS